MSQTPAMMEMSITHKKITINQETTTQYQAQVIHPAVYVFLLTSIDLY
jgi:hypothetical protein